MMRSLKKGLGVCAALMCLALGNGAAVAQSKIAIGYIPVGDFIPAYVAVDKGFFKEAGLDAQLVPIPLATNVPAAVVSGSIQIGMTTTPIMFQARESGIDLVAISGLSWDTRAAPQLSLIVRKDGGIKEAKDLVGKKIAFPGLRSLFDAAMIRWLETKGVDPKKVTFLEAQMPQLVDLLKSGNVDAIAVLDPFRTRAITEGVGVKLTDFLVDLQDNQPLAYWMTTREYAAAHATEIKAFRAAMDKSLAFIKANPDEAKQIGGKYMRGNIMATLPNWSVDLKASDMTVQTDMEHAVGMLQQKPDVASVIIP
jgi:NitT/TauT family transport system substrate-binding protein